MKTSPYLLCAVMKTKWGEKKPMRELSLGEAGGLDWSINIKRPKRTIIRYVLEI